jgi:hypothetical protein
MNNFEATIFTYTDVYNYGMKLLHALINGNSSGFGWVNDTFLKVNSYLLSLKIEGYE